MNKMNKMRTTRNMIIIGMFLLHAIAAAGWAGELVAWGNDRYGQVSKTPSGNDFEAVSIGIFQNVALKSDGSLVTWGTVRNTPPAGNDFTAVESGGGHTVALKSDGTLISWGSDASGQVSNTPKGNDFVGVSAGLMHSVALRSDGSLIAWGYDGYGQVSDTPKGYDFKAISAGRNHNLALRTDGSLVAWGADSSGQVSKTPSGNGFVAIAAGGYHSVALKSDGSLVAWGIETSQQVFFTPKDNDFVAVAAGYDFNVALKSDGSLVAWGVDYYGQVRDTPTGNDFVSVTAGYDNCQAIRKTQITPKPIVSIAATDVSAGEPANNGSFTVSRTGATTGDLLVYYSTSGSTALSGTDYAALPGYVYILSGQYSASIPVAVIDDTTTESSETVRLTISSNSAYTIGSPSYATVTITDNDDQPPVDETIVTITATDASAGEPDNNGAFKISRTGDTSERLLVFYSIMGSTAYSGTDYERLPGYVYIPSGQTSAFISVDVIDDYAIEDSETAQLTIRSISGYTTYTIGSPSNDTVTITDNDSELPEDKPIVTITAPDASAAEPANDGYFTVSRTGDTSSSLRVYYSTSGSATAGTDYVGLSGYIYIPAGQTSAYVDVVVIDDGTVENSETVQLTISSNAAYTVGSPSSATVTITDDDDAPPPPADAEELMAKTLAFFYESKGKTLVEVGLFDLYRMQYRLEKAYDRIVEENYDEACVQLWEALSRCDGYNDPPDYVSGEATADLAGMIQEVINELGC